MVVVIERKSADPVERVFEVARQQKRLIALILLECIWDIFCLWIAPVSPAFQLCVSLGLRATCAYIVYKVSAALEMSKVRMQITAALQFVPGISLVALLYIIGKATKFLRAAGVQVGLQGAKTESMDRKYELG